MSGRQGFISNGQTYVYQESTTTGSAAFGLDSTDNDTWKLKVETTDGALPSATPQMEVDPVANGSIYFTPNGTGVMNFDNDQASTASNVLTVRKTRSGGVITTGDVLGQISFQGIGTGTTFTEGASITSTSSGTIGANRVPANLVFATHPDSASGATATTRMTIAAAGGVTIAAPTSGNTLTISSFTEGALVSSSAGVITSAAPSTAGFVLTSNGAGLAPTFQAAGGGVTSLAGTTNQITASASTGSVTLSIPSTFIAPGTVEATTTVTAGTNFISTAGNVLLPAPSSSQGQIQVETHRVLHTGRAVADGNIFVGRDAGNFTLTGSAFSNQGLGNIVLASLTSGSRNVAIGESSLTSLTTGARNICIGHSSGTAYTTEDSNIIIGAETAGTGGTSNSLRIGAATGTGIGQLNSAAISGITGKTSTSGVAVLVNSSDVLGTTTSSRDFKENIEDIQDYSDIIYKMRPVSFNYKDECTKGREEDGALKQYGLIAEEVEELDEGLVAYNKEGKPYSIRYHFIPILLLNEVQKLNHIIGVMDQRIRDLEAQLRGGL